jgi:hypothetical protein
VGVQPCSINLSLGVGEKVTQQVSIDIENNQQLLAADMVFVIDESASMGYGHQWIQNMIQEFGIQFANMGIDVRFALIGFASGERIYNLTKNLPCL